MTFRGYYDISKDFGFRKWSMSVTVLSLVSVNMANFGIFADLCTARKEEFQQILLHKLVGFS